MLGQEPHDVVHADAGTVASGGARSVTEQGATGREQLLLRLVELRVGLHATFDLLERFVDVGDLLVKQFLWIELLFRGRHYFTTGKLPYQPSRSTRPLSSVRVCEAHFSQWGI